MVQKIKIIDLDGSEIPLELIAENIERIAKAGEALLRSRLSRDALHILLQQEIGNVPSKISLNDISRVLNAIPNLRNMLNSRKKK